MTGPWLVRRLTGDARRHRGVWLGLGFAFALLAFCAASARVVTRRSRAEGPAREPAAHVIAYLKDDLEPPAVDELRRVLAGLPGVEEVRLVAPAEALERLRRELGARAAVVDGVGADLMFSSIEIAARPAAAASLAFRLRRLPGIAEADLVTPDAGAASSPPASLLGTVRAPFALAGAAGVVAGVAVLFLLGIALARLRGRVRGELDVLMTFGLPRGESARPALVLAVGAGALGTGLGLAAALFAARAALGTRELPLPPREWAAGAVALVGVALALSFVVLRVRDVAD